MDKGIIIIERLMIENKGLIITAINHDNITISVGDILFDLTGTGHIVKGVEMIRKDLQKNGNTQVVGLLLDCKSDSCIIGNSLIIREGINNKNG